jgi:hypothetical protein
MSTIAAAVGVVAHCHSDDISSCRIRGRGPSGEIKSGRSKTDAHRREVARPLPSSFSLRSCPDVL